MGIMEFMQKIAEDKEFAAKYQALSSLDAALEEAEKDGYSITEEEALKALQNAKSGELSDEEMASDFNISRISIRRTTKRRC